MYELPEKMWMGKVEGEWPVYAFVGEDSALRWMQECVEETPTRRPHLWLVKVVPEHEMEIVPPVEARLRVKGAF